MHDGIASLEARKSPGVRSGRHQIIRKLSLHVDGLAQAQSPMLPITRNLVPLGRLTCRPFFRASSRRYSWYLAMTRTCTNARDRYGDRCDRGAASLASGIICESVQMSAIHSGFLLLPFNGAPFSERAFSWSRLSISARPRRRRCRSAGRSHGGARACHQLAVSVGGCHPDAALGG